MGCLGVDGVALVAFAAADSALHLSTYWVTLIGKIMCFGDGCGFGLGMGICGDFEPDMACTFALGG